MSTMFLFFSQAKLLVFAKLHNTYCWVFSGLGMFYSEKRTGFRISSANELCHQ
ncbi:hypothetical protein HMPREF6745_1030 [Prevotella sp. oral taxon 472 str. F0295]|nr:hypothetical protein HMPREF6745_1030 [Prevotella sp. oral taxon 472 str. F0295]